ncbi:hypothetical protein [Sphingobacterium sp.]|uniref:hypothetical protein n=1 Tax=Sphingobacterium sp. TaxID=341027 RepID=UPI0028AF37DE|nr:hypothetical protein [Sphingobacterium sp.]
MLRRLFAGSDFDKFVDYRRLKTQIDRVFALMKDSKWRTLQEIQRELGDRYPNKHFPESSISAQLRNLRKEYGGFHTINKRRRGKVSNGTFEYQLEVRKNLLN